MVTSREEMTISPRIMAISRDKMAIVCEILYVLYFGVYFLGAKASLGAVFSGNLLWNCGS